MCNQDGSCDECEYDRFSNSDGLCEKCSNEIENCIVCNYDSNSDNSELACTKCEDNFYYNA